MWARIAIFFSGYKSFLKSDEDRYSGRVRSVLAPLVFRRFVFGNFSTKNGCHSQPHRPSCPRLTGSLLKQVGGRADGQRELSGKRGRQLEGFRETDWKPRF